MKTTFKIISVFWILSPIAFSIMRGFKVFDFRYDWGVFLFLSFMSTASLFFNVKEND